jgi:glycosyltransferase involved in cell wall biosynthesis
MSAAQNRRLLMVEVGGRGGVADYTAELVGALSRLGWSIELATATDHLYSPIEGVRILGVFHYLRDRNPLGRALRERGLGRIVNGLRFLLTMPRLMWLAARADIVHTQGWENPQIGLLAVLCLRITGTPVVQTLHNAFERATTSAGTRRLARRLTGRLIARTIVHTQADLGAVSAWVGDRTVVIPHGEYGGLASRGGGAERAASRAALGIAADAPVTLMFGQLRPDKGLGDLVEAVRRVPTLHLLIGGQDAGGLNDEVREQLSGPDLAGRVTLREGFMEMGEAARLFAATDTVALPYKAASQSGVLLLAYGFARPVIVYPTGGMVESVVDGQTGWICESPSVQALAEALAASVRAGASECLRRGERGRVLAQERFAWPLIARRTDELYREVLNGA